MTECFLFIGEKRSQTAMDNDWHWSDERLSAIQLFGALRALGIEPEGQEFENLWDDEGGINLSVINYAQHHEHVVAMGQKVHQQLERAGVDHITIAHPAARGKIRKKENYLQMLANKLTRQR
jgi:hypothetical protein